MQKYRQMPMRCQVAMMNGILFLPHIGCQMIFKVVGQQGF